MNSFTNFNIFGKKINKSCLHFYKLFNKLNRMRSIYSIQIQYNLNNYAVYDTYNSVVTVVLYALCKWCI